MKKLSFILSIILLMSVIVIQIKPMPIGWLLSLICGFVTGCLFVELIRDKTR